MCDTNKCTDENMFRNFVQNVFEQEKRVKTKQLSEHELLKLIDIVDTKIILKYQKLSTPFIKQYIVPQIIKENESDPSCPITYDDIRKWQKIDEKINLV